MKARTRVVMLVVLLVSLVLPTSVGMAETDLDLPIEMQGDLNGAAYKIRVPENWNGTLLVYARGYDFGYIANPSITLSIGDTSGLEDELLSRGYALAASGFSGGGYAVAEGIEDTKKLTELFVEEVGDPTRVILYGASMGTIIALKSMELYPEVYDAAVPMCDLGAGATANTDHKLDLATAYAVAFGWKNSWGDVGDVRDKLGFSPVMKKLTKELDHAAENFGRFEFVRLVSHLPLGGYYQPAGLPYPAVLLNSLFFTLQRAEMEMRAGGPIASNVGHVYSLTEEQIEYLKELDPTLDPQAMLEEMNAMANVEAAPDARPYLADYADYSGQIQGPVLMVHNIEDPITMVQNTTVYRETVEEAGTADLLSVVYSELPGHCNMTDQILMLFEAMDNWLDSGKPPEPGFFDTNSDFNTTFDPGPWPQPLED